METHFILNSRNLLFLMNLLGRTIPCFAGVENKTLKLLFVFVSCR